MQPIDITKVEQSIETPNKKKGMAYLTVGLGAPITESLEKVVARLNAKGSRPYRKSTFNYNIVVNIYYGKYRDVNDHVKVELLKMNLERLGLMAQAQPHLEALEALVRNN